MSKGTVFTTNLDVVTAKGWLPYWRIALELGIHENTLRNWMKTQMTPERNRKVLEAINKIKHQEKH